MDSVDFEDVDFVVVDFEVFVIEASEVSVVFYHFSEDGQICEIGRGAHLDILLYR